MDVYGFTQRPPVQSRTCCRRRYWFRNPCCVLDTRLQFHFLISTDCTLIQVEKEKKTRSIRYMEQLLRNFQICQSGSFVRVQLCLIFISESCRYRGRMAQSYRAKITTAVSCPVYRFYFSRFQQEAFPPFEFNSSHTLLVIKFVFRANRRGSLNN